MMASLMARQLIVRCRESLLRSSLYPTDYAFSQVLLRRKLGKRICSTACVFSSGVKRPVVDIFEYYTPQPRLGSSRCTIGAPTEPSTAVVFRLSLFYNPILELTRYLGSVGSVLAMGNECRQTDNGSPPETAADRACDTRPSTQSTLVLANDGLLVQHLPTNA